MKKFEKIEELQSFISDNKKEDKIIGFVPTMGALHEGHLSLVNIAKKQSDIVIVSIFVNPTQFNDPSDLKNYPRTIDKDLCLLDNEGVSAVFYPDTNTIYPQEDKRIFDIGEVGKVMEGEYRPGHFNGVMQVVSRLFDIIKPDKAFFGEKDFQQIAVIKAMLRITKQNVEIVSCPIHRAENGLALSSRNALLTKEQLNTAPYIYKVLKESTSMMDSKTPKEVVDWVTDTLNSNDLFRVEYFQIVDADTLKEVNCWNDSTHIQGCITVYCGKIRLIDNIKYK